MDRGFDPYHKWLGIPAAEQPPHFYRLLAVGLFEADGDVISAAADARMAQLRSYQTGPHAADSQRLLSEVAQAQAVLLAPAPRAAYDAALRQHLQAMQGYATHGHALGGQAGQGYPAAGHAGWPAAGYPAAQYSPAIPLAAGGVASGYMTPGPAIAQGVRVATAVPAAAAPSLQTPSLMMAIPTPLAQSTNAEATPTQPMPSQKLRPVPIAVLPQVEAPIGETGENAFDFGNADGDADAVVVRPAKKRGMPIIGVVLGGFSGLAIGYAVLITLRSDMDFLHVFSSPEVASTDKPAQPKKNRLTIGERVKAAVVEVDEAEPNDSEADGAAGDVAGDDAFNERAGSDATPGSGEANNDMATPPGDGSTLPMPTPTVPTPPQPPVSPGPNTATPNSTLPLELDLPSGVALPALGESAAVALLKLDAALTKVDDLAVVVDAVEPPGQASILLRPMKPGADGCVSAWTLGVAEGPGPQAKLLPMAQLTFADNELRFVWDKSAAAMQAAGALPFCGLKVRVGDRSKLVALREVDTLSSLLVEMNEQTTAVQVFERAPPRTDALWVEIGGLNGLPIVGKFKYDKPKGPLRDDDTGAVIVDLGKLNDDDYPELHLKLAGGTDGGLDLEMTRLLRTPRSTFALTRSEVAKAKSDTAKALPPLEMRLASVVKEGKETEKKIEELKARVNRGAAQRGGLTFLRTQLRTLNERYTKLTAEKNELDRRTRGIGPVEDLVARLDGNAKLEFRVFVATDVGELTLAQSVGWKSPATPATATRLTD